MIQTANVTVPRAEARELYRKYKEHLHYSKPVDRECMRAYQLIAQGRLIIRALESIKLAGLNEKNLPKLAIARADETGISLSMNAEGSARMTGEGAQAPGWRNDRRSTSRSIFLPVGTFPRTQNWMTAKALVPSCPLHLRPRRGLENYHILWEAEWTKVVPRDPFLLRRIGQGDLWVVVAQWDLTEVERAALATRL